MSFANIIKDIGSIYQRLFDHQPVLQGECAFFYHQFEGNGRSAEFDSLLQTSHLLNEAVDSELDERMKRAPFDKINAKLEAVSAMIERTVAKGQKVRTSFSNCHQFCSNSFLTSRILIRREIHYLSESEHKCSMFIVEWFRLTEVQKKFPLQVFVFKRVVLKCCPCFPHPLRL